ncbi:hypothetical protein F8388_020525 [Cannabis sativa]|uniref:CCHC-type domain-containing protein n=1 Tax=Cannabis sativa TaxID=3483 RepID=A0A7J6EZD8_CANSA|nr:hypothetical protein F8388_020525 [Cannabis sativa]
MAQGSFLLPLVTVQGVPGYYIPSLLEIHFFCKHFTPFRALAQGNFTLKSFCFPGKIFCNIMNMNIPSGSVVEELIEETENVSLNDFSIQVEADNEGARATVESTVVGRFFSKKLVSNGTLRKALSGMWKLSRGWRLQSPAPKTFIFRLNNPREVKYVLENGPWNPCGGFMMAVALPEDGRWESADFSGLEIWVKALGVPMPYLTDECLKQMANRMGTLVRANKVRHNGTIVKDYLRFQVRINLLAPLLAGVSLPDLGNKKVWSYFKYERLPLFCFKCGIIGHEEDGCSGRKRMVAVHDGRSIPLYGPWLRDGARLENGFALLEVDELQDRRRLERPESSALVKEASPKVLQSEEVGSDGINRGLESSPIVDAIGGSTRVEKEGMEGVVSQRSDNSFEVAYNDYVDCSHFPTQHVVHVANIFKEKLGTIKFGASREEVDSATTKPVNIKKLKKPCVVGPRGIPRPPIFGRTLDESGLVRGNKRKKISGSSDPKNDFVDESQGQCCFIGVDKTGVKEAFGEVSGVNQSIESNSRDEEIDQSKKARLITQTLRSEESSFEADKDSEEITRGVLKVGGHEAALARGGGLVAMIESAPARLDEKLRALNNLLVDVQSRLDLAHYLGFRKLNKEDRFLGNPIIWSNSKVNDLKFIKEKVCSKIEGWRCKLLSQAGRSTLIRAVAQSSPIYSMATFLIPKTICTEMDQAVRKYWWTGNADKERFLALIDWNSLCLPLDRGGLNFKKFEDINLALISKLGWKLASEDDSLWCKVFKAKYMSNGDKSFWSMKVPKHASFGAKGIMASRDLIRNETCWLIGNGRRAEVWNSPWIPWLDWNMFRAAFNPLIEQRSVKVSTLIGEDGEWRASSINRWFVPSVVNSWNLIKRLPNSRNDLLVWKDATNGLFSPSVAYKSIIKNRWGEPDSFWNRIWKLKITERLKMFLWKLCKDILPFGSRLSRIFGNNNSCVICGEVDDSAQHLFWKCPLAKAVWFASRWSIRSENLQFDSPRKMVEWILNPDFLSGVDAGDLGEFNRFGICLIDELWTARNRAFHERVIPSWRGVLARVQGAASCLFSAWDNRPTREVVQHDHREIYVDNLVLFVDAAFKDLRASAGIVVSNLEGSFLEAQAVNFDATQPLEAESWAIIHALYWCQTRGWRQAVVVSDCLLLVQSLKARRAPDWRFMDVFWKLLELLDALPEVEVVWKPRAMVQPAHLVAQWAFRLSFSGFLTAEELVPLVTF